MKHNFGAVYADVKLRPLEENDIEKLRIWRNDASKTKFLRNIGEITPEMQKKWYEAYLKNKDEIVFAIEETAELNRMIGSVALYNFDGKTAEIGKIQIGDVEAHGRGIGRKSFVMAMWIGFQLLGIEKFVASVHQENIAAYSNYMKIGFQVTGKHPAHIEGFEDEIEIDEDVLKKINTYVEQIKFL